MVHVALANLSQGRSDWLGLVEASLMVSGALGDLRGAGTFSLASYRYFIRSLHDTLSVLILVRLIHLVFIWELRQRTLHTARWRCWDFRPIWIDYWIPMEVRNLAWLSLVAPHRLLIVLDKLCILLRLSTLSTVAWLGSTIWFFIFPLRCDRSFERIRKFLSAIQVYFSVLLLLHGVWDSSWGALSSALLSRPRMLLLADCLALSGCDILLVDHQHSSLRTHPPMQCCCGLLDPIWLWLLLCDSLPSGHRSSLLNLFLASRIIRCILMAVIRQHLFEILLLMWDMGLAPNSLMLLSISKLVVELSRRLPGQKTVVHIARERPEVWPWVFLRHEFLIHVSWIGGKKRLLREERRLSRVERRLLLCIYNI